MYLCSSYAVHVCEGTYGQTNNEAFQLPLKEQKATSRGFHPLAMASDSSAPLFCLGDVSVYAEDVAVLEDGNWLNDNCISFVCEYVVCVS
jgi:Ulp1 family protease